MKTITTLALCAACLVAGCGDSSDKKLPKPVTATPAAAAPAAAPTPAAAAAPAVAEAKESKPEVPEVHGMPGMADLFKGDEKKAPK